MRLTMLCLGGFELYSRWMPLNGFCSIKNGACGEINTSALVCLEDKLEGQNNA